jgi:signal transduction histidine kinase
MAGMRGSRFAGVNVPALVALLVGAALGALAILFWHALDRIDDRLNTPEDNVVWGLTQLEQEYNLLRLEAAKVKLAAANGGGTPLDEDALAGLQLRLDLFVSRVRILQEGTFFRQIAERPALAGLLSRIEDAIGAADATMAAGPRNGAAETARRLEADLSPLAGDLRRLSVEASHLYNELQSAFQAQMRRLILTIGGVFLALAAGVLGFLVVLGLQHRRLTRTNESLSRLSEELKAANQTKSRFLANMSHELRTPLNAILGFSEIMRDQRFGALDTRYQGYAGDIHRSAAHLLALINDVLDLSKVEAGRRELEPAEIFLATESAAAARLLEPKARARGISVALEFPDDLPPVLADPLAIRQVLLNLLSNAIKFSFDGGRVRICATARGGSVEVRVIDAGIGIPESDLERVTRPFEQVRNAFTAAEEGTGLGLSLSKGLVEMHGGCLVLESDAGRGTTARFTLPAGLPEAAREAGEGLARPAAPEETALTGPLRRIS